MIDIFYLLSGWLFCVGLFIIITKKNAIMILMGIELILNAANLNLVASHQEGAMLALFIMVVAICETSVGLAIIIQVYRHFKSVDVSEFNELKEKL